MADSSIKNQHKSEHHRASGSESLSHEAWSDHSAPKSAAHNKKGHNAKSGTKTGTGRDASDGSEKDKIDYPPTHDPLEERKKLTEPEKAIFDGLKAHDGIILSNVFNEMPDAKFKDELEKVKWIFNEGLASRNIAVGVDTEKAHVYGITNGGNPVQFYARTYDKANDVSSSPDYSDPVQRENILKELYADKIPELRTLNPVELELYAGMQKKDGMLIRGALSKMDPAKFDEETSKITAIFNKLGFSYAIDVDRDEKRLRIDWITQQGNPAELYGGPYPLSANTRYVRP